MKSTTTMLSLKNKNLVAAYLATKKSVETKTQTAARLGVSISRLGEWKNGRVSVPESRQRIMRRDVLAAALGTRVAEAIAPLLEPPEPRRRGLDIV